MVTASNKAWNMQQLLDVGADGYFIKEDPESNPSEEVSKSSYEAFKELIKKCQDKYNQLKPFWKYIKEIEERGTLIEEKSDSNGTTKVNERIKERLKMFFGLLKRTFEDSEYNKQFHYSDIKLAFMTLWSCLNDIQYIYYEKQPDNSFKIKANLIHRLSIPNNPNDYHFLTFLDSNNKLKTRIKEDKENETFVFNMNNSENGNRIKNFIGQLIAFLIFAFENDITKRDEYLKILYALKNKRNHLYLTHGDENSNDFFHKLEQENQEITLNECKKLFEIVYFLLTRCPIQIQ
jgi:hypothetical protein